MLKFLFLDENAKVSATDFFSSSPIRRFPRPLFPWKPFLVCVHCRFVFSFCFRFRFSCVQFRDSIHEVPVSFFFLETFPSVSLLFFFVSAVPTFSFVLFCLFFFVSYFSYINIKNKYKDCVMWL